MRWPGWLVEAGSAAVVIGLLGLLAVPTLEERREQARTVSCEAAYVMLQGEVESELTSVLSGGTTRCGTSSGNFEVLACTLTVNVDDSNPRNRYQTLYTTSGDTSSKDSSCRVGMTKGSTNGIRFNQFATPQSATSRTFSVTVD